MTQEALKLALEALEAHADIGIKSDKAIAAIKEALAQPTQEPVAGTKTWFEDGKVVTQYLTAKDIYKDPEEQEPVAFAGIEIWVGNARIAKYLTQTELHYARDPWMLMQYSAEMCISKLKEKNNG